MAPHNCTCVASAQRDQQLALPGYAPGAGRLLALGDFRACVRATVPHLAPKNFKPFVLQNGLTVPYFEEIYQFHSTYTWREETADRWGLPDFNAKQLEAYNAGRFEMYLLDHDEHWEARARLHIKSYIDPEWILDMVMELTSPTPFVDRFDEDLTSY